MNERKDDFPSDLRLVRSAMKRCFEFNFDGLMDECLSVLDEKPPPDKLASMLPMERFQIWQEIWNTELSQLAKRYCPTIPIESITWTKPEITPYTLVLCRLTEEPCSPSKQAGPEPFEVIEHLRQIPAKLLPKSRLDQEALLHRFLNFPPLRALWIIYLEGYSELRANLENLASGFGGLALPADFPKLPIPPSLRKVALPIPQKLLELHPIEEMLQDENLHVYNDRLAHVKAAANESPLSLDGTLICPHCVGSDDHHYTGFEQLSEYQRIVTDPELANAMGYAYFEDFERLFREEIRDGFLAGLEALNRVNHPNCLIMVEGRSEEESLPLLAVRLGIHLGNEGVFVHNSGGKEKLLRDFLDVRRRYPKRKIVVLLDSDAGEEREGIERLIRNHKDLYHLEIIADGTFEDLFPLLLSVRIINELYPEGETLQESDFDTRRTFLMTAERLMYEKKRAKFDKVAFARQMAVQVPIESLSATIVSIINTAKLFADTTRKPTIRNTSD